ncbi:MAG: MFS transporter [Halanaerobiaceae bacterium]
MLKYLAQKVTMKKEAAQKISDFSKLQFFFWSTWAIYGAYIVYYLTDIGYTNMQIGTVMSIRTFMEIISPPILGYICDRFQTRKTVFIFSITLLGLMIVPFPLYNKVMILIVSGLIGFFWSPQQSILDSWILETSPEMAINYGFMRAWGSIGYAAIVAIFGLVIENFGWTVHYISYGLLITITAIIAYLIKDKSYDEVKKREKNRQEKGNTPEINISQLFLNKSYLFVLLVTVLIFIPIITIFIYLAPIIKSTGGTAKHLGYTLFFNALSEAPIFFIGKSILKKFETKYLLLISAIFYLIRIVITSLITTPLFFIFFGLLQSLSYGIFLISVRHYIKMIAPPELQTTAQSIVLMAAFGVGGITASLGGGYLIDNFGMNTMFTLCIILSSLAVLLLSSSLILDKVK